MYIRKYKTSTNRGYIPRIPKDHIGKKFYRITTTRGSVISTKPLTEFPVTRVGRVDYSLYKTCSGCNAIHTRELTRCVECHKTLRSCPRRGLLRQEVIESKRI